MDFHDITGYFNFNDIYDEAIASTRFGGSFVEVGCLWGRSTAYLAGQIKAQGVPIKLYAVDVWDVRGVPELSTPGLDASGLDYSKDGDDIIYRTFLTNVARCGVLDMITPLRLPSVDAAKLFADNSLSMVFIDANHEYEYVKSDILAWLPKVKVGGILAGHDYDWVGVKRAVDEVLGSAISQRNTSWFMRKTLGR